jgi:hypothetical protein
MIASLASRDPVPGDICCRHAGGSVETETPANETSIIEVSAFIRVNTRDQRGNLHRGHQREPV